MKTNTMKLIRLTIVMLTITAANSVFSANYYSQGNGNFNTLTNWNTLPGGGGTSPASIVAATDTYYIQVGHEIIVNDSVNIAILDVSGTLTFGNDATARSMWVNGTITVNATGSILVGSTGATHKLTLNGGNLVNNGTINLRPATSSRVVNLFTRGTVSLQGANSPILSNLTVSSGTTTAARVLDIKGNLTISTGTTFNAGAFTHTLAGNFLRLGTFNANTSTFELNAPLVQSISSTATFNNLTVNGGGILSISGNITVNGNFLVGNNSTVNTSTNNRFDKNWEVQSGSEYKATAGQTQWYGATAQNITIAGTVQFYELYAQYAGLKTIYGNLSVTNTFFIYSTATVTDGAAGQTHTFSGNVRLEGTAQFTNKVILNSPSGNSIYHNTPGNTITFGAADIEISGYVWIGNGDASNTTLHVQGDLNLIERYLVIRNNSAVTGTGSKALTQATNTNLYCRGTDNYPSGFGSYTHEAGSFVRYDWNIDQTIRGGIDYPHLYLQYKSKTLGGNINVDGNLYLYSQNNDSIVFQILDNDVTVTGNVYDDYNNDNRKTHINQTGGTFTLAGVDVDQYFYRRGPASIYQFNNFTITNIDPTAVRTKYFVGNNATDITDNITDFYVAGDLQFINTSSNQSLRMQVDFNNNRVDGQAAGNFGLGDNVIIMVGGNQFNNSINSFATTTLDANSTVRYDANGTITIPTITYGNLEFGGNGGTFRVDKPAGIVVLGDISRVNGSPTFQLRSSFPMHNPNHRIHGDWNLTNAYIDASVSGAGRPTVSFIGTGDQIISQATFWHVEFGGSGTKTLGGNMTVYGNLTIGNSITVDALTHSITIGGNWSNVSDGVFTSQTNSSVLFNGTGTQNVTVQAGNGSLFNSITIDKPSGTQVNTTTGFTISRHLIFTQDRGDFNLNGNTLYIGGDLIVRPDCQLLWSSGAKIVFNGATEDQLLRNYNASTLYPTLEFTGAGLKRFYDNPFNIEGDIVINSATVRGEWYNHYLKGDFINNDGNFSHSATLYFNGEDQTIDAGGFYNMYFTGNGTKFLNENQTVGGSITIDTAAVLDASPDGGLTSYNISLEMHWYNNIWNADSSKTGQFIPRSGTVTFYGDHSNIYTGDSIKADHTGRTGKQFYNLVINNRDNNTWTRLYPTSPGTSNNVRLANDLRVLNDFTVQQGIFYNYWDKIYVGGNFDNSGGNFQMLGYYGQYPELYFEGNVGPFDFNPGTLHQIRKVTFRGTAEYQLQSPMTMIRGAAAPNLVVSNGKFSLNNQTLSLTDANYGDVEIGAGGELIIDSLAELKIANSRTINNYGIFRIVGTEEGPATMGAVSGTYSFKQHSGITHAKYYSIENTRVNGMEFLGGTINTTNNFTNGQFIGGIGNGYITLTDGLISIGTPLTLNDVKFYDGPANNIIRQNNTGASAITFVNAGGTRQGAAYESDPGNLVDWTYTGAKYWTGLGGDSDWNNGGNWTGGTVPDENSTVVIDNTHVVGAYTIDINADATAKLVTLSGTASTLVINGAELEIKKNLTILAGNTLAQTQSTDTITIGGSWANAGTHNPNTSVVKFTPANGSYTINSKTGDTFYDLVLEGTNGEVGLGSNITVTGNIKLISGTLKGSNKILYITGNWYSNFTSFEGGTGTVQFNRNDGTDQIIDGGSFNNVTFSGSSQKNASSTLFFNGTINIMAGTVFNGGTQNLYVRSNWYNRAGDAGFTQTGTGTVFFDGNGTRYLGDYSNLGNTTTTTFNHLSFTGPGMKYIANSLTVKGNLYNVNGSNLYVGSAGYVATTITGTASGSFNMDGGVVYLLGVNSFPDSFSFYNITGGTVEYRGNVDQTVRGGSDVTYYNINLRSVAYGNPVVPNPLYTKTVDDHLYVKNLLYILNQNGGVDAPTLLDMDNKDMYLEGALIFQTPLDSTLRQISWGTGTLYHDGGNFNIYVNTTEFNNIVKRGTGVITLYNDITLHGNMFFNDNTNLNMQAYKMVCDGVAKNFTIGENSYLYSYIPDTTVTTQYAFPTGFASYTVSPTNTYYVRGAENQSIMPGITYGGIYLLDNFAREVRLHGDLNARTLFIINYDQIELVDNGHDLYLGGYNNDLRNYTATSTIYLDGATTQRIYAGGIFNSLHINNLILSNGGIKTLEEMDVYIGGDITISNLDTLRTAYNIHFSGSSFTNNGRFEHTARSFYFQGADQTINPGNNTFNEVFFQNSGTKTVKDNGFNIRNNITISDPVNPITVDFGTLTHNLGFTYITIDEGGGSSWDVTDANLIFDRNGNQYIPGLTAKNVSFTVGGNKYMLDSISCHDLTIGVNAVLWTTDDPVNPYPLTVQGNWLVEGNFVPYTSTVYFESNNTDPKTITSGTRSFYNVIFNSTLTSSRTYTLVDNMTILENLTLNSGAFLKLGGKTLTLGNDDIGLVAGEITEIKVGATLEVDAEARLLFNLQDLDPQFNVRGTLKVVGTGSANASIAESLSAATNRGIKVTAFSGSNLEFKYYNISRLNYDGFVIENGANIHATNNFSDGVWNGIYTGNQFTDPADGVTIRNTFYYMQVSANTSGIADVSNVIFNHGTVPVVGRHYNIYRPAGSTGNINLVGDVGGNMGVETYELDPDGLVIWPPITKVTWNGVVNSDWFTPENWSPPAIPDENRDAEIPLITDGGSNPVIYAEGAICRTLNLTNGILTIESGVDTVKIKRNVTLGANAILAIEDNATLEVFGDWSIASNATFVQSNSTVYFNRNTGSSNIYPRNSAFHKIQFDGGATYYLNGTSITFNGDFIIDNGTVTPFNTDYTYQVMGDYQYNGGTFTTSVRGTFNFANGNQTIKRGRFSKIILSGSGTKTFSDSTVVNHNGTGATDYAFDLRANTAATFAPLGQIEIKGIYYANSTSTFADNGGSIVFKGSNWIGYGNHSGTGDVTFSGATQFLTSGKFANLNINSSYCYVNGFTSVSGDLNINSIRTEIRSFGTLNSNSGTGTFNTLGNTVLWILGTNNYPNNFAEYNATSTSTVNYRHTSNQTVRGKTGAANIAYGNVIFENANNKTLEGDIHVGGYFQITNSAQVYSNNNSITVYGNWNNQTNGSFYCQQGEVVFTGANNQEVYISTSGINNFYKVVVNKETSSAWVRIQSPNCNIQDKLWIRGGRFINNNTVTISGDLIASNDGWFNNSGTYILNKATGNANIQGNNSSFNSVQISGGATYTMMDDFTILGQFDLNDGTFLIDGNTLTLGDGADIITINGVLKTGAGGTLKIGNICQLNVQSGGEIHIVGTESEPAIVTRNNNNYYFNVESGGKIHAKYYLFEYMRETGIYIKAGAEIDEIENFSHGTFTNPTSGGICLKIENTQSFTGSDSLVNITFPVNPLNGTRNIVKTSSSTGIIDIHQWSGALSGPNYEGDSYNLINWKTINTIKWVGGTGIGETRENWNVATNWDLGRVPEENDKVIIENTGYKCYIRNMVDTVSIGSLTIKGPLYLIKDAAADRRVLNVSGNVDVQNQIVWDGDSTMLRFSGDYSTTSIWHTQATNGGTIILTGAGYSSMNGQIYNSKLRLIIEKQGTVAFPTHPNRSKYLRVEAGATMNLTNAIGRYELTGSLDNFGTITQNTETFQFYGTGNNEFYAGSSAFGKLEFITGNYLLTSPELTITDNSTIQNGAELNTNGYILNFGHSSLVKTLTVMGTLRMGEFGQARFKNTAKLSVQNPGQLIAVGDVNKEVVFTNQGSGRYEVIIGSGATIQANHYKFEYLHANGLVLQPGSLIHATNNLSNGVYVYGDATGYYLNFQNNFADTIRITNVNFSSGALYNAKRPGTASGIINFRDAFGLKAGHYYEDDDLNFSTGKIVWTYTTPTLFWTGTEDTRWDNPNNFNPNGIPTKSSIVFIQSGCPNYPVLNTANAVDTAFARRLTIYSGATMTMSDGKDVFVAEDFVNGGTFTISSGSTTYLTVNGTFSNNGTFTHGGASTLDLGSPNNMELTLGGASVYNLILNSDNGLGDAELSTRSSVNILGNLTIDAGIFKVTNPSHVVYVAGHFTNNSGFAHGNATLYLNGSAGQNISNANGDSFYNLTLSGTGAKTLQTDITILNDISIGAVLNAGTNHLNVSGDWMGNKTFNRGTSTVRLNGTSPQFITKSETFYNLVVNNTAPLSAITLQNIVNIENNLTFTRGKIESGNTNTLTILDNATMTGANPTSYIIGYLSKTGDEDFTFPIGTDNVYAPVGISGLSGVSTFKAVHFESAYNNLNLQAGLNKASQVEHWIVNRISGSAQPYLTFHWLDGTRSEIDNLDPIVAAYYQSGFGWKSMGKGSTTGNVATGSVTSNDRYTQFGYCGFGWTYNEVTWTGADNNNWNNPLNWSGGVVPTGSSNVIVPNVASQPILDINASCFNITVKANGNLTVPSGYTLDLSGNLDIEVGGTVTLQNNGQLRVAGHFTNLGTCDAQNGSNLVFNGTNDQNISNFTANNLTFSGAGEKYLSGTNTITGNLTISSTVRAQASTLNLAGNWNQPSGSFVFGTSTVRFNGTAQQTITSGTQVNYWNLIINNSFATSPQIVLAANILIKNNLTLTDGVIRSTASSIISVENGATSDPGSADSYVWGPMRKLGIQNFVFPLGKENRWARLGISDMAGSGAFDAEYFESRYSDITSIGAGIVRVSGNEYWDLSRTGGAGTAQPHVTLYWEDTAFSKIDNLATLAIGHFRSGAWQNHGGNASWTDNGTTNPGNIKSTVVFATFSPITFASTDEDDNPLPVELIRFNAAITGHNSVLIEWETASEYNNERFELAKSMDGVNFETVATLRSKGDSQSITHYGFEDFSPFPGNTYYRLKQVDYNGLTETYPMISVFWTSELEILSELYPNPTLDKCYVEFNQWLNQSLRVDIFNIDGKWIAGDETRLNGIQKLDISHQVKFLDSGIYYVKVTTAGHSKVHKLIKK